MKGLIGKKIGMTSIFTEEGNNVPCTVIEVGPCVVTQIKTDESDGYNAVQIAYGAKSEKNTTAPLLGHFDKAGTEPKRIVREIRDFDEEVKLGDELKADIFSEGESVHAVGTSKGKGFQGVVKRHGFSGVGMRTHGQHDRQRAPGAIGMSSDPSRVFKGMKMGGRTGGVRAKMKNLRIQKILADKNIMFIEGAVPGHKGAIVFIEK